MGICVNYKKSVVCIKEICEIKIERVQRISKKQEGLTVWRGQDYQIPKYSINADKMVGELGKGSFCMCRSGKSLQLC